MNNKNQYVKKLEIHFEIISQCKLNCVHCSSGSDIKESKQQLSPKKIANFIKAIRKDVKLYICLTGGEPLLSNQLFPIANTLNQFKNINQMGLFSSGCIATEKGEIQAINKKLSMKLKENGITFFYISLYSHLSNVHDKITKVPDSHKYSIRSIRNLLNNGIEARVNFVPMKYNQKEIVKVIHFLNDMGIKEIRFLRLVEHGHAKKHWGLIGLSKEEQKVMLQKAIDTIKKDNLLIKITVAGFPEIWDCRPFGTGKMCQAGIGLYYIDWKGNVFPCACKKREETFSLFNVDDADVSKRLLFSKKLYKVKCLQDM